jgi:hypothetical protein
MSALCHLYERRLKWETTECWEEVAHRGEEAKLRFTKLGNNIWIIQQFPLPFSALPFGFFCFHPPHPEASEMYQASLPWRVLSAVAVKDRYYGLPCLAYSSSPKMEAVRFAETSVYFCRITRHHIPEYSTLHSNSCENLKPDVILTLFNYTLSLILVHTDCAVRKRGEVEVTFYICIG